MAINEGDIVKNLNLGQNSKKLFSNTPEDPIVLLTKEFIEASIDSMKQILEEDGRNTQTSTLSQSIDGSDLKLRVGGVSISITANDYAKFIDEGVKGVGFGDGISEKLVNTTNKGAPVVTEGNYSFKPTGVSPSFVEATKKWIAEKPTSLSQSMAYVVASNIKRRGIRPSNFISKTFTPEALEAFGTAIGLVVGESVTQQFIGYGEPR